MRERQVALEPAWVELNNHRLKPVG
jgi:hypothetical protein